MLDTDSLLATLPPLSYSPFESPSLFKGISFLCKGFDSANEVRASQPSRMTGIRALTLRNSDARSRSCWRITEERSSLNTLEPAESLQRAHVQLHHCIPSFVVFVQCCVLTVVDLLHVTSCLCRTRRAL
jgi:hypothetical protein